MVAAEDGVATLNTWPDVQRAFHRYGHCDDGAIAEGHSAQIMRLLSSQWDVVAELDTLAKGDVEFREFVLRHIDETWLSAEFERVMELATNRCPSGAEELCSAILRRGEEVGEVSKRAQRAAQQGAAPAEARKEDAQ
jgi:hypothetical protein